MIYFAKLKSGSIKIGFTANLERRIIDLRHTYVCEPVILKTFDGDKKEERIYHARFAHLQFGKSEQFRPGKELTDFLGLEMVADYRNITKTKGCLFVVFRMSRDELARMDNLVKENGLKSRSDLFWHFFEMGEQSLARGKRRGNSR